MSLAVIIDKSIGRHSKSTVQPTPFIRNPDSSSQTPGENPADLADIKRKSVRGGVVTLTLQGATITIQLTSTVILARLLSPQDYGIMAMVLAVTNFAALFRDLGLSSAAIQKKNLTRGQQSNLFWLNVAMGALLTVLVAVAAPFVVWFYGMPELLWVTVALSLSFLIGSIGTQHGAMLVRSMQFGRQGMANISGALVSLGVSVVLAMWGWSYWSLVLGNLAGAVATTTLLVALSSFRPTWLQRGTGVRGMVKFGANVTAYDFVNYFHRNLDNVLIGKFVGAQALGLYSRAYALLMLPISNLRGPITAVGYPALSRLQDQPVAFRDYYRKMTHILALIAMPLTAFLFVVSEQIVLLMLGPSWAGVAPIFAILALVALIQPVLTLWGIVVLSLGLGRRYVYVGVFNTISSTLGFVAGLPWGVVGVATGYAIATYLAAIPTLLWAFLGTPVRLLDFFASVSRPFFASIIAGGFTSVLALHWSHLDGVVYLVVSAVMFIITYTVSLILLPGGTQEVHIIRNLVMSHFAPHLGSHKWRT